MLKSNHRFKLMSRVYPEISTSANSSDEGRTATGTRAAGVEFKGPGRGGGTPLIFDTRSWNINSFPARPSSTAVQAQNWNNYNKKKQLKVIFSC